jgi:ABC-2 type transport system permease protein
MRMELMEATRQPRGAVIALVALLFFAVAFAQGTARVAGEGAAIAAAVAENRDAWLRQPPQNPHGAAHFAVLLAKPPAPLGGLVLGVEGSLAGHVYTDAHRLVPASGGRAADLPFAEAIGVLDVAFVVGVVLPLFAVLLGADLVAGEKERGTLRLVFANPVGRGRWLAIRFAARAAAFVLSVGLAAGLAWGLAGAPPLGEPARLAGFAGLSAVYLAAWVAIGVACSAFATRLASASLAAIALWIGLVIVAPRVMASVAELGDPPPMTSPARMDLRIEDVRLLRLQQKLVDELKAKGALAGASATTAAEGPASVRERIDGEAARARAKADAPAEAWRARQLARLEALAPLSPAALYFQAAAGLAGTDGARHAAFLDQALAWRKAFLAKLNALEDRKVPEFRDYDAIAPFAFAETPAAEAFRAQASRLGGLLAMGLLAFGLAIWRFRRYDLR